MALDLSFSEEQLMLREMVRGLCEQYASTDKLRELEDDPIGYSSEFWSQLAALDLTGLLIPEQYGGSGMSMLDATVVYEEFGRALAPSPHFVSSVMAAGLINAAGSDPQRSAWLPKIASGEAIATIGWLEPTGGYRPAGITTTATPSGDGFKIDGLKRHVAYAASAQVILVLAQGPDGVDLFLVDPHQAGVTLTQKMTIASDTQYDVEFVGVEVGQDARLGASGSGWGTFDEVLSDGLILLAASAVGGARYCLDITVEYSKDRYQFDKPLGSFQSLSHYMADAVTNIDGAEVLVHEAAWARSSGKPFRSLAAMSKLFACNTFRDTTAMAQQIWGGVGFTVEYDVQLYFRRAKALQISWLDTQALEDRIASEVLVS
jgi:alkylation response protein AidB-like acyl-CoA dehydrogenase